jgi:hypothetical protein
MFGLRVPQRNFEANCKIMNTQTEPHQPCRQKAPPHLPVPWTHLCAACHLRNWQRNGDSNGKQSIQNLIRYICLVIEHTILVLVHFRPLVIRQNRKEFPFLVNTAVAGPDKRWKAVNNLPPFCDVTSPIDPLV